jgi:hypothetical protein
MERPVQSRWNRYVLAVENHVNRLMRVDDWDTVVEEIVESSVDPEGWQAVGGDRQRRW